MAAFVFPPEEVVGLPVWGQEEALFPVRRIYCVGRNYAAHAREMGGDPDREPPFFFCKHHDARSVVPVRPGETACLPYPGQTVNYHYETELVVAIGTGGSNIPVAQAAGHIFGYAVGLDMTRRDLQAKMKEAGKPWEIGKAFDFSAPVGMVYPVGQTGVLSSAAIRLTVNEVEKQHGNMDQMTWSVAETISRLSELFRLCPGDLIFTGTPEGVGAVVPEDVLAAEIEGLGGIRVRIAQPE